MGKYQLVTPVILPEVMSITEQEIILEQGPLEILTLI